MPAMRTRLLAVLLAASALAACTEMDEAALVDPGTTQIEADPGELRVLRHHDDPIAGDQWIDVLTPDPAVVVPTDRFREADSRHADEDQPADLRLLYEAVDDGRTVLVRLNCRSCRDGVPATDPDDTEVLVWDFLVGTADDEELLLGHAALTPDRLHVAEPGEHVVVVRGPGAEEELAPLEGDVLRLTARHVPDDGAELLVDVFTAVGPGEVTLAYGADEYVVRVS